MVDMLRLEGYVKRMKELDQESVPQEARAKDVERKLAQEGLQLHSMGRVSNLVYKPGKAGDGKHPENSVVFIRRERDW